jgi:putative membrane protein
MRFLIRLAVNAVALYAAIAIMSGRGIEPQSENWVSLIWLALIFGIINAVLRPILTIVGCPFIILTLGLGALLINTLLFYLAGVIGQAFGVGFEVENFWAAFLGALIVTVVSFVLNAFFKDTQERR